MDKLSALKLKIEPFIRMSLFMSESKKDRLGQLMSMTGCKAETIIRCRCGYSSRALRELLNFTNPIQLTKVDNFDKRKAYIFQCQGFYRVSKRGDDEMDGLSDEKDLTRMSELGHCFVMIYRDGKWLMLDSYLGLIGNNREFEIHPVSIDDVVLLLEKLDKEFTVEGWKKLTRCHDVCLDTEIVKTNLTSCDYSIDDIDEVFESQRDIALRMFLAGHPDDDNLLGEEFITYP